MQFPAGLVTVEIIRFLPVGFVLQKSGGAVVFLLFSSIGRIELADGQSPQCDRTLWYISSAANRAIVRKGTGGLALAGGGEQKTAADVPIGLLSWD